jgi:hypothetical protein
MANAIGSETDAMLKNMVGNLSAHLDSTLAISGRRRQLVEQGFQALGRN